MLEVHIVNRTDPTDRHVISVANVIGTNDYDAFVDSITTTVDFNNYYVDAEAADDEHYGIMCGKVMYG